MTVTVVGLGYVGLSISVLLSRKFQVHAVDIDVRKVEMLRNSVSPIADPDITNYLETQDLNLLPTTGFDRSVSGSKFVVVATPTDYDPDADQFDVSSVRSVVTQALAVDPDINIVIKSTIPIGFGMNFVRNLAQKISIFHLSFCERGVRCMTTCIHRASSSEETVKPVSNSLACSPHAPSVKIVRYCSWVREKLKRSSFLLIPILLCVSLILTSWTVFACFQVLKHQM